VRQEKNNLECQQKLVSSTVALDSLFKANRS